MATINYVTLKFPEILLKHVEKLQDTKSFSVYRYTLTPGIIFRIPHGVLTDDVCHFFIEHEVNSPFLAKAMAEQWGSILKTAEVHNG